MIDLHKKFLNSHRNLKISYTLFTRLRPFWTVKTEVSERDTCLSIKHENMSLVIQALHQERIIETSTPQ